MVELHEGERIITKIRKHWLVFFIESFGLLLAALAPFFLLALPLSVVAEFLPELDRGQAGALMAFIAVAWEFALFIVFMILITTYYLDVIVVTNKRVLDMDQIGLFARDVVSMPIEQIQDVKIRTMGILAEIFKFGSLDIQTAGDVKEVQVRGVRYPEKARDAIMDAYHTDKHVPQ